MILLLCHIFTGFSYRGELALVYRSDVCRYASVRHLHLQAPDFDSGVFDCLSGDGRVWNLFMVCCCAPVYYGVSSSASGFMGFWLALVLSSIFMPLIWIFGFIGRIHIRQEFSMRSACLMDCLAWFFCVPCVLTQENKFMKRTFVALRDGTDNIVILPTIPLAQAVPRAPAPATPAIETA